MGVDPGIHGALATWDYNSGSLSVIDMPNWTMQINNKNRTRVDAVELLEYMEVQKLSGVELVMIEAVGGRPKQSAGGGFTFGYTVGLLYMACVAVRLPIETVPPQTWKKLMRVPGKAEIAKRKSIPSGKAAKEWQVAIINRADECFPNARDLWRGKMGGMRIDRAEAALLAMYAGRYALNSTKITHIRDAEFKLAYHGAETGA